MNEITHALFKDLIESSFKKGLCVRSTLNIIWMLENSDNIPKKAQEYLAKLKLKEKKFNYKSTRKVSGITCEVLNDEKIFLKRFQFFLNEIKDLTPHALYIVDSKSIDLLNHSIKYGLDINCENNNTYLLKYALENKNNIMSNYLYYLPNIDKLKVDSNGNNLAHIAASGKNYSIINHLSKEHLSLFYIKNNDQKTAIDIIFNYKQYDTLPRKNKLYIKECILNFIKLHHDNKSVLPDKTLDIINNSSVLKNVLI
jgi:hypothetical protein